MKSRKLVGLLVLATGVLLSSWASWAQGTRVVRFSDEIIRGKVHKPEVMMLITRQNLNTNYKLDLRETFLPKIVEAVNSQPF
jgi:hypothetical protein